MDGAIAPAEGKASPEPFRPFCYAPLERDAPFLKALYYLSRNPLELLTRELYEIPVSEKRFLGRRALFLNDPGLTRRFFSDRADTYTIDPVRKLLLKPGFGSGLASIDGPAWAENRTLTRRYFKPDYLERYAEIFRKTALEACGTIDDGATIDLQVFLSNIALGSAASCLFSSSEGVSIADGVRAYNDVMKYHMTVEPADVFLLPHFVPRFWKKRAARPLRRTRHMAKAIVEARLDDGGTVSGNDLLSGYFQEWSAGQEGSGATRKQILDNVGTMLGASFETTSLAMTWTLYFLLQCPSSLEQVTREVRAATHSSAPGAWSKQLPRTTASLSETLRVYPILPAIVRYATEAETVGDLRIRRGDFIVANLWTQHRDERHWPDAQAYRPERFLNGPGTPSRTGGYFPFGVGPRACIGTQFAMLEGVIVLATVLERFDLALVDNDTVRPEWRGTLRPDRPIRVRVRRRQEPLN